METPLLKGHGLENLETRIHVPGILRRPDAPAGGSDGPEQAFDRPSSYSLDSSFLRRLMHLMMLAKAQGALLLVVLSVLEVLVVAQVGVMPGLFYKALLDNDVELFGVAMWRALLWYGSAAVCAGVKLGVSEMLALQWRKRLTLAAHSAYCCSSRVYHLMRDGEVDNPDQRIAQEIQLFSTGLAQLLLKTVVCPLMIVYYTVLVWSYIGWTGPLAVYAFFSVGTLGAKSLISPIAALVARQEKLEGNFRVAHVRLRTNAEQVALYKSSSVERSTLDSELTGVLSNQRSLVVRHTILELGSKLYDYSGSILNYAILALPIFIGIYGKGGSIDKGAIAQLVSNASFAVLTLIYSFTQLIDAAKVLSDVAGVTGRVAGLFEALDSLGGSAEHVDEQSKEKQGCSKQGLGVFAADNETSLAMFLAHSVALTPSLPGWKEFAFGRADTGEQQDALAPIQQGSVNGLLSGPTSTFFQGNRIEYSVHAVPLELLGVLQEVFSEQAVPSLWSRPLLVVPSFQCARTDLWHVDQEADTQQLSTSKQERTASSSEPSDVQLQGCIDGHVAGEEPSVSNEMARLADVFLRWQDVICESLRRRGFWAAAVDPRTGFALSPSAEAQSGRQPLRNGNESSLVEPFVGAASVVLPHQQGALPSVASHIQSSWERSSMQAQSEPLEDPSTQTNGGLQLVKHIEDGPIEDNSEEPLLDRGGHAQRLPPAAGSDVRRNGCTFAEALWPVAYSEVHGAELLLGYDKGTAGTCPVVLHPSFKARTYPASLLTSAPADVLMQVLAESTDRDLLEEARALVLDVRKLTVLTTGGALIVRGLDLRTLKGERVMLMGPSGCGKSTLVRSISGLWPQVEGSVRVEPTTGASGTLVLPQTPLLARGSLAAQLTYPLEVPNFAADVERRLLEALAVVGLENLLQRVGGKWTRVEDWPVILSPGEQQRLSLARVLFHRPQLAIVDEATSAIGEALEAHIYEHLALLPMSLLTISHRHTLKQWHTKVVHLLGDGRGGWTMEENL